MQTLPSAPTPANLLQSFLIDRSHIRGKLVRLQSAADTILSQHHYPAPVAQLLAEMLVTVAMLSSNLKKEGVLTLQATGDGAVRFIIVDATDTGHLRGYAEMEEDASPLPAGAPLSHIMGKGKLAITLDQGGEDGRYQGIVELEGESFAEAMQRYFTRSQQVEMHVKLAVSQEREGWKASGILIEQVPAEGGEAEKPNVENKEEDREEQWRRASLLFGTVREEELLDANLSTWALLTRLFGEDGVWAYTPHALEALCRCSDERIAGILASLPAEDLQEMTVDGELEVHCQFCNTVRTFRAEIAANEQ